MAKIQDSPGEFLVPSMWLVRRGRGGGCVGYGVVANDVDDVRLS